MSIGEKFHSAVKIGMHRIRRLVFSIPVIITGIPGGIHQNPPSVGKSRRPGVIRPGALHIRRIPYMFRSVKSVSDDRLRRDSRSAQQSRRQVCVTFTYRSAALKSPQRIFRPVLPRLRQSVIIKIEIRGYPVVNRPHLAVSIRDSRCDLIGFRHDAGIFALYVFRRLQIKTKRIRR